MGRPIKKKWFTAKWGSSEGNLRVLTTAGAKQIFKQVGTGVYETDIGRVKLVDGGTLIAPDPANGVVGTATMTHNGATNYVRKISQYRIYFFDSELESSVWRDSDENTIGVFVPDLVDEAPDEPNAPDPATAKGFAVVSTVIAGGRVTAITILDGGAGYVSPPTVTIANNGGSGSGALATAEIEHGEVSNVIITDQGSGYSAGSTIVTFSAPLIMT